MSDEPKKDTPSDGANPPADKPQFKVTRSPFAPKVGGPGQASPVKPQTDESAKEAAPAPEAAPVPAAPTPPKPIASAPKPKAPTPAKPKPKTGAPAQALETQSSGPGIGLVALDAVCAIVAVAFGILIFMGM